MLSSTSAGAAPLAPRSGLAFRVVFGLRDCTYGDGALGGMPVEDDVTTSGSRFIAGAALSGAFGIHKESR